MFIHDLVSKKQQNIIQESSGLGDVYRDVAELNDLGLTLPEIAQRLGMSTQEAEEILSGVQSSANDSDISEAVSRAQQAAIAIAKKKKQEVGESANKGLYYNVNKRKKAGTSRDASHPKAPTAQAWRDAAKTAKNESVTEGSDDIASAKELLAQLERQFDSSYEYSDDHSVWKKHNEIRQEMNRLKKIIGQGEQGVAEATGDEKFDTMMKKVAKTPTQAQRNAERIRQKREREEETRKHFANGGGFGPSPADKLSIRKGVAEGYDSEELANEVYAEFERIYPNLARQANERTVHAAILDVLNYGDGSDPGALAQDVARAVKRDMQQDVAEGYDDDGYGYKSLTKEQIIELIRSGNWEAMSDINPGKHLQLRNTRNGKNTTVHVKQDMAEGDEHDLASLQKYFDPSVAYDAASHKPAMMQRKDLKGKTHHLVKQSSGNYKSSPADYDQMIRDVANSTAAPEHKKAVIDALMAKKTELSESTDGLNPGDNIKITTIKGSTYTGTLSHINDNQSIVLNTMGTGGNPHDPADTQSRKHVVAIKMSHVATIESIDQVTETSAQDKLHQQHQTLRQQSGLPHPNYYKELKATFDLPDQERQAKVAEIKKKYNITESDQDRQKYVINVQTGQVVDGPFDSIGEIPLRLMGYDGSHKIVSASELKNTQGMAEAKHFRTTYGWAGGSNEKTGGKHKHPDQTKADKEANKAEKQKQSRDAFDGMFGGGNPADKLSVRKKDVAEGIYEDIERYVEALNRAGYELQEEKTRLDPKCWTGKKIGNPKTKVKGGVRVNNCVPK
jgi:hypothetical protein